MTGADLARAAMTWADRWWDPDVGLLWNMEGSFTSELGGRSRVLHLVPQSAWYAAGLLARDAPGDRARAVSTIDALCSLQYDRPGAAWHGTFARFLEVPEPGDGAVMWEDYDPNWRQFVGTTFALILSDLAGGLPEDLVRRMHDAIDLAVDSEPDERVPASYSNIALMKAWLDVDRGSRRGEGARRERGLELARDVVGLFDRHGCFEEYNSPTYYGIDLYALALWRARSVARELREWGARVAAALWRDFARWYHPDLRNVAGPYTRAYGMDLTRSLGLVGLWMWEGLGRDAAPVPRVEQRFEHAHDFCLAPLVAHLGAAIPHDARPRLVRFCGEHDVRQVITDDPARVATAWLGERVMIGAESSPIDWGGWAQVHPATVHWAVDGARVGWVRIRHAGPVDATAHASRLEVRPGGDADVELTVHVPDHDVAARLDPHASTWRLPGIAAHLDAPAPRAVEARDGGATLTVRLPSAPLELRLDARP